jgi:hypothetical protein
MRADKENNFFTYRVRRYYQGVKRDMMEKPPENVRDNRLMQLIVLVIVVFGACLVLYSVYMLATHVNDLNMIVLDMIMFGFGFAAIWFGLTHFDIQKSENKIQEINKQADRIKNILEKKE